MIDRIIELSLRNKFLVVMLWIGIAGWGLWAMLRAPIDAIPDLSDNQAIVFTDWSGRGPQEVGDQVTYPLTVNLQCLPGVKVVRSSSAFGFSMIFAIFNDDATMSCVPGYSAFCFPKTSNLRRTPNSWPFPAFYTISA